MIVKADRYRIIWDLKFALFKNRSSIRLCRIEPRHIKRRPKAFQLMTKPRSVMREIPHRGKYTAKSRLKLAPFYSAPFYFIFSKSLQIAIHRQVRVRYGARNGSKCMHMQVEQNKACPTISCPLPDTVFKNGIQPPWPACILRRRLFNK